MVSNMKRLIALMVVGIASAGLLAACGGGGGDSGDTNTASRITLTTARDNLPTNIGAELPIIGAWGPYTTELHVFATKDGKPIPDAEDDVFSCDVRGGLNSGALYYLDGKDEHQDEDGNPMAFRSIVLGSNAGGASFHFHSGTEAGEATIVCAVANDPRRPTASATIAVGGATGLPSSVDFRAQAPGYLGSEFNTQNLRNSVALQAMVMDDANQPVPDPQGRNVEVRIHPGTLAASGARLEVGAQSGQVVRMRTIRGIALLSLASGPNRGPILLEATVDRWDNDVDNGIQDPVTQLIAVPVVHGVSMLPLVFEDAQLTLRAGVPFAAALGVEGGTPPYEWSALAGLPSGLSLSGTGVLSGTALVRPGTYVVRVRIVDAFGNATTGSVTLNIEGAPVTVTNATISGTVGTPLSYALNATDGVPPYSWSALGALPAGLSFSSTGVISGTPGASGTFTLAVQVTDRTGESANGNITLNIQDLIEPEPEPTPPLRIADPGSLSATVGTPYSYVLSATGGAGGYLWEALDPGSVPPGLVLESNGLISGTPTTAGAYSFAVKVEDQDGSTSTANLSLTVD